MKNTEWLKSLSDRALAEEINCGRTLANGDHHKEHHTTELKQAWAEYERRTKALGGGDE